MTSTTGLFKAAAKLAVSTARITDHVVTKPIKWSKTQHPWYPFEASIEIDKTPINLKLRLNDFPEEILYTVVLEHPDNTMEEIDEWNCFRDNWEKPGSSYTPK
ncbi:MAG: hypothetical protein CK424_05810 [Legionella sp.]|nr:MAG: hypothetical protein CK424_05810 [Legionella sp.]